MTALGSMSLSSVPPEARRVILIQPGAVAAPSEVIESGIYEQEGPLTGPDVVTVTEIEDE